MQKLRGMILIVVLALVTLSACAPTTGTTLNGTSWELDHIVGMPLIADTHISLTFEDEDIRGNSGCNTYFGGYTLNRAGGLQFGMIVMTEMACLDPAGAMQQESTYLQYLGTIVKAVRDGDQLRLQDAAGDDILVYTAVSE